MIAFTILFQYKQQPNKNQWEEWGISFLTQEKAKKYCKKKEGENPDKIFTNWKCELIDGIPNYIKSVDIIYTTEFEKEEISA